MKTIITISALLAFTLSTTLANEIDGQKRFMQSCVVCHTNKIIDPSNKANLIGPPADEVLTHVKEKFPKKGDAVKFMVDYIMQPDAKKALCASIDRFGVMPSMKGVVTKDEAVKISEYMFDTFPREEFAKKDRKVRAGITFEKIDSNSDGFISPQEFREFRAKKNGIDVSKFKQDAYFKKIDLNGDGKMDRDEFKKMREAKMRLKANKE